MKLIYILFIIPFLFSCTEEVVQKDTKEKPVIIESVDQKITRHIEAALDIPATEKYTVEKFSAQLNTDDSLDMIITVNLLDRAMEKALKATNIATRVESSFMGRYNFLFFYDGATQKMSVEIPVPSSAMAKLNVQFEHIRSEAYYDALVEYKLENASFTRFFTIINRLPKEIFEMMNYQGLGDRNSEAFYVKYGDGSYSLAKDIFIYKGELEKVNFDKPKKIYDYKPTIKETDILERQWFFNDNDFKYYTNKK